jgi:hypothetical protein
VIECECGFAYSEEFYKLYPEQVDDWHAREHDGNLTLQLHNHILETLDRLLGENLA